MGLTPVSGLPGGTRTGDIDPSLVFHFTSDAGNLSRSSTKELHITNAEEILNKKSGWKAITGTADFSEIAIPHATGSHKLAFDIVIDRIVGYVGNYYVKLGGQVDALVFSGGIGESSAYLRQKVVERVQCLGFEISKNRNDADFDQDVTEISPSGGKVLVCKTDEEEEMAMTREWPSTSNQNCR